MKNINNEQIKKTDINPLNYKSFFSYLWAHISSLPAALRFKGIYNFLKKYFFIGRIFKYTRIIINILQTSTYILVYLTVLLIAIPIVLLSILFITLFSVFRHKKHNNFFKSEFVDNDFDVIFLTDEDKFDSQKINDNNIKIYVIKNPTAMLPTAVKEVDENTFFVSTGYFYSLKKSVLDKTKNKVHYLKEEK